MRFDRRGFLTAIGAGAAGVLSGPAQSDLLIRERRLRLIRPETDESVDAVYVRPEGLDVAGYVAICTLCRDHHVPESKGVRQIDLRVLDRLAIMQAILWRNDLRARLVIHSGFRTDQTNRAVGGATDSYHLSGQAIDFRFEGLGVEETFAWVRRSHDQGGLGFYPPGRGRAHGWLHLDSGKHRVWHG